MRILVMMIELNLKIYNSEDLNTLLPILERMGIHWERNSQNTELGEEELKRLYAIIDKGGDTSYMGDALEWQKKQRKDREMPFRKSS